MLRTRNGVGRFIYPRLKSGHGQQGTREDLSVFVPDDGEWACTIEGNPDEGGRCFIVENETELRLLIYALDQVLVMIEERRS